MPKAPKQDKPSVQYRTSAYTVREYMALPYSERIAVNAACDAQAREAKQKALTAGPTAATPSTGSETPYQSTPTQSIQLAMQLATADFAADETAAEEIAPETIQPDYGPDEIEEAPAAVPVATEADESLPYSADLLTVASEFVSLHEHTGSTMWTHWGPTPFADSEGVQFALNAHTNTFKCFITGTTGGIVAFVGAVKRISNAHALDWLSINFPLPTEPEDSAEPQEPEAAEPTGVVAVWHRPASVEDERPSPEEERAAAQPKPIAPAAIHHTLDYDLFHLLPENRAVDAGHVRKLVAMIKKTNLLHIKPLDVTADMGVIDGQHRLAAARELGLPIYYKITQELSEADITTLNVAQKNWTGADWLHYWSVKGRTDYQAMSAFMQRHPRLSFSNVKLMLGETAKAGNEEFRAGRWKAGQAFKAEQVAMLVERIADEVPTFKQPTHSGFVAALYHCVTNVEGFDAKEFMRMILLQPLALVPCASQKQFMETFSTVYNWRKNAQHRVNFN